MKKALMILGFIMFSFAIVQDAGAHAIWIESNTKAVKNKPHQVKVFYGEYPEGNPDSTQKWFSDLKNLEVWVISPSQRKTKLALVDAATHMASSFVPDEDGIYYITTSHPTKELGGTTKYEFSSVVPVSSGNVKMEAAAPDQLLAVIVQPKTYKSNELIALQVRKGAEVLAGKEVVIMSPEGWVKTLKTNDKGQVAFTPIIKGSYVIETSDYKKEEGEWNQKKYTGTWNGSTTRILVN